jgi:sulfur relay protein TusB/DsrH
MTPPATATCLHLVLSASPTALACCRDLAAAGDTVLFADEGVLHLLDGEVISRWPSGCELVVSAPCLAARGPDDIARAAGVPAFDDSGFADLLRRHPHCLSWT